MTALHAYKMPVLQAIDCEQKLNSCMGLQSKLHCRFARLANGGSKVAIADMLQLPELSGNVLMEQILRLFDGDRDGYLTEAELIRAVQKLGELQQPGADPCQSETHACFLHLCLCALDNRHSSSRELLLLPHSPGATYHSLPVH